MNKNTWYLRTINIARRDLNMDEAPYRANLREWTGKDSLKKMSLKELGEVLNGMKRLGFKLKPNKGKHRPSQRKSKSVITNVQLRTNPSIAKLGQLWTNMAANGLVNNKSYWALEKWATTRSAALNGGVTIEKLPDMSLIAPKLIEQLKQYKDRLETEATN